MRNTRRMVIPAVALMLLLALVGCTNKAEKTQNTPTAPSGTTAKAALPVAQSALSTMAPDAKLLVVQTAQAVTTTSTPVWAYLFGSPSNGSTYLVYVANGKAMGASKYGTAGLSKAQWSAVPPATDWKIDSDTAYQTAFKASGAKPGRYMMGLQTYVPSKSETQTAKPLTWYVSFETTKAVIPVDAKTGAVSGK